MCWKCVGYRASRPSVPSQDEPAAEAVGRHERRWYLAVESQRLGHGADRLLFEITGVDEKTIRRGREELAASLAEQPTDRIRQPGGGRPPVEKNTADPFRVGGTGRARNGRRSDE